MNCDRHCDEQWWAYPALLCLLSGGELNWIKIEWQTFRILRRLEPFFLRRLIFKLQTQSADLRSYVAAATFEKLFLNFFKKDIF